jgi:hypothetical protein
MIQSATFYAASGSYYSSTVDAYLSVGGMWVLAGKGLALTASTSASIGLSAPLLADGLRLVFTATPNGRASLGSVSTSGDNGAVYASPFAYLPGRGTYDYVLTPMSRFGQTGPTSSANAVVYAPTLAASAKVMSDSIAHLIGTGAASLAIVQILSGNQVVVQTTADSNGGFAADAPLVLGTNTFQAVATDSSGNKSMPSDSVTVIYDAPAPVTLALTLSSQSGSNVGLSWTMTGDASRVGSLEVKRATKGAEAIIARPATTDTTYIDSGLPNGAYTYRIVPVTAAGLEGAPSNAVEATVNVELPPAPADLTATARPEGKAIQLSWTFAGQSQGFIVERSPSANGSFTAVNPHAPALGTSFVDRGLANGTPNYYRLYALDALGNAGAASNTVVGTPRDSVAPEPPTLLQPTVSGTPITLGAPLTTVAGTAELNSTVEVFQSNYYVEAAPANVLGTAVSPVATKFSAYYGVDSSVDGAVVAYIYVPSGSSNRAIAVETLAGHSAMTFSSAQVNSSGPVVLAPDLKHAAWQGLSGGKNHVYIGDLATGAFAPAADTSLGEELSPAWSPDSSKVAFVAKRAGTTSLGMVSLGSTAERLVHAGGSSISYLRWLRDGRSLLAAMTQGDGRTSLTRFDIASDTSAPLLYLPTISDLAVAPLGDRAVVIGRDSLYQTDLYVVDLWKATSTRVTNDSAQEIAPVFSTDGKSIVFLTSGRLAVLDLETGQEQTAEHLTDAGAMLPLADGRFMLSSQSPAALSFVQLVGRFSAPGVILIPGENAIFADAVDASRNVGPYSQPLLVTFDTSKLADLSISAAVEPVVPIAALPANAIVTITNFGNAAASNPEVNISVLGTDGTIRTSRTATLNGTVAPGGKLVGAVPINISGLVGPQKVYAVVDPSGTIPDSDRSNNSTTLSFSVTPTDAMAVSVAVQPGTGGMGSTATVSATIVNPRLATDAIFHVSLHSKDGAQVLVAGDDQSYSPLAAFTTASFSRTFTVGAQLAADYQVVVEGRSPSGDLLASGSAPFTILPDRTTDLALASFHGSYLPGEAIEILSTVKNLSGNAILSGAELRLRLTDAANAVRQEKIASVPVLPLGEESRTTTSFSSSALAPGDYRVTAEVWLGATLLRSATAALAIVNQPKIAGSLAIRGRGAPPVIPSGAAVEIEFRIQNVGPTAVTNLVGHLAVIDPDTLGTFSNLDVPLASLAAGASYSGSTAGASSALAQKTYLVSLSVEADGLTRELVASGRFRIGDAVPPQIVSLNVSDGEIVQGGFTAKAQVVDASPGVAAAEVSIDGAAPVALTLQAGSVLQGTWTQALTFALDGAHVLVFDAVDGDGNGPLASNATNPVRVTVISDTVPPEVTISGVAEGELTNADVVPIVSAIDVHLVSIRTELNGTEFKQGATIAEDGDYLLLATATDRAMNVGTAARRFTVDKTPPRIVVAGINNGDILPSGAVPNVRVSDAHLSSQTVSVDRAPYSPGTPLADGPHMLDITAEDAAGNHSELHLRVTVGNTPPVVELTGFAEGEVANRQVRPAFTVTDSDLAGATAMLNQQPFNPGTVVNDEGDYVLEVLAWDSGGNQSAKVGHFVIDKSPPGISLSGIAEGEVRAGDVAPVFSVDDAHLTAVEAHYILGSGALVPFASGDALTAEGEYALTVNAEDAAGNHATASVRFSVDRSAPEIQTTGVVDGEVRAAAVIPVITVTDAHLASVQATLTDGLSSSSFTSGTALSQERDYILEVHARDRAGNLARQVIHFGIDLTAPAITIAGVDDGEVRAANIVPSFTVTDAHLRTSEVTLRTAGVAAAFTSGTMLAAEADYELEIRAADAAGNGATRLWKFAIDRTAPQITISGFPLGGCVAADVTPTFAVTEAHPHSLAVSADGAPFTVGQSISTEGRHQLSATATDLAGNSASASAALVLDKTPPEITVTGVEEGASYSTAPAATFTATDANLTTSRILLDGAAYQSGTRIVAPGMHVLTAEAVDCAGNQRTRAVHFSVNDQSFDFEAGLARAGRVLLALGCEVDQLNSALDSAACPVPPALGSALHAAGMNYDIAGNGGEFMSLMRTNRYRAYVVWGQRLVSSLTPRELREHVWEGAGLLFASDQPCAEEEVVGMLGVGILGTALNMEGAEVLASAPPGPLPVAKGAVCLAPGAAQVLAVGSGECANAAVATLSSSGLGSALAVGFDPEQAPSARMTEVMAAWLRAVASGPPFERVPLSIETVELRAKSLYSNAREVRLTATPPQTALVLETDPEAAVLSPPAWFLTLESQEEQSVTVSLGLSDQAGPSSVLAELAAKSDGLYVPYAARTVPLPVARSGSELLADAQARLSALVLDEAGDWHRGRALEALAQISGSGPTDIKQVETRIECILDALGEVAAITSDNTDEVRLTLDALLRYWELRWTRLAQ